MTDSLKNVAENLFNEFELDDKKIKALLALENASSKKRSYIRLLSKVASLFAVAVFITLFAINQNSYYKKENMVNLIVAEVVNNHRYLKPLEVTSSQLVSVSKYFNQLSFSPYASNNDSVVSALSNTLIGGRYCSIQGTTAAQLRMESSEGSISTLFQVGMSDSFLNIPSFEKGEASIVKHKDGYEVQIWQEKGLLMVWVKPASS
ncbi:MAG: hypothetical protein ACJAYK_001569 [Crocinitomicaceae bacterium]|jgi:hypothetical protein